MGQSQELGLLSEHTYLRSASHTIVKAKQEGYYHIKLGSITSAYDSIELSIELKKENDHYHCI